MAYGVAYTYSKSMDDGSAQRNILPNAYDAHNLWGPSDFDRRHVFVGNVIYELPFFRERNLVGSLLGGWQIGMLVQLQSGVPLTVGTADDVAGVGPGNGTGVGTSGSNDVSNNSLPPTIYNIVGDPHLSGATFSNSTTDQNFYFNTKAFEKPAAGTFTTQSSRNILYNPGFQNWTASLFKNFRIGERQLVTFRSEFYNFPNHPNWSNVDSVNPTAATFGKVVNKNFERTIQLSLRYQF